MRKIMRLATSAAAGLVIAAAPVALISAGSASAATVRPNAHLTQARRPSWPTVGPGAHGNRVWAIQYLLRARGYKLRVDGRYGSATVTDVRRFQLVRHLRVDGAVGPATWPKLVLLVRPGNRGYAVRALQDSLHYGYRYRIAVDGFFGRGTRDAVLNFQRRHGLARDGVAGLATWRAVIWNES
jgi:peptidoglycan hydrolase-like protein with peptidoglycan-binding domain